MTAEPVRTDTPDFDFVLEFADRVVEALDRVTGDDSVGSNAVVPLAWPRKGLLLNGSAPAETERLIRGFLIGISDLTRSKIKLSPEEVRAKKAAAGSWINR